MANGTLSTALDPEVQHAIGDRRERRRSVLGGRDRLSALLLGGGFLVAAALTALLGTSSRDPGLAVLALLVVSYALAFTLDFEVIAGSFVPTQVVLVPMLFVAPVTHAPLLVAFGILAGSLLDYLRGAIALERVFSPLVNGWHVFGPVLVLGLAGESQPALSAVGLYALALAAQFGFDLASLATHEAITGGASTATQLRAVRLAWLVDGALSSMGLAVAFAATQSPYGFILALPLILLLSVFARERKARIDHALELSSAYRGTAFLLGDVIEADDAYTGSHSRDVVDLTLAVCDELGLGARERRDAEFVALLHDVGKVRIPNEIINKPGKLTPEERAVINTHTIIGEKMLERVGGLLGEVGHLVRSCHERWDGEGYPDGLAGEAIPLIARIVCCCDAFNAMTTDRPYRAARTVDEALEEVARSAGTHFDPAVADALARVARSIGLHGEPDQEPLLLDGEAAAERAHDDGGGGGSELEQLLPQKHGLG